MLPFGTLTVIALFVVLSAKSSNDICPNFHLLNPQKPCPSLSSDTFAIGVSPANTMYTGVSSEYSLAFFLYETFSLFSLSLRYSATISLDSNSLTTTPLSLRRFSILSALNRAANVSIVLEGLPFS